MGNDILFGNWLNGELHLRVMTPDKGSMLEQKLTDHTLPQEFKCLGFNAKILFD